MKNFVKAIREVNFALGKLMLFEVFINSLIIFLFSFLLLSLFNLSFLYALIPTGVYLISSTSMRIRENKIRAIEKRFIFLNEKLRTAADNINLYNPVADALKAEVMTDLGRVDEASFFNERRVYLKSALIVLLCFLILLLAPVSLVLPKFGGLDLGLKENMQVNVKEAFGPPMFEVGGPAGSGSFPGTQNIYSTKSVAKLGEEKLDVEIRPAGFEINVRNVVEAEEKEFLEQYPEEVFAVSAQTYQEKIPKEQQELVKNYFKELAEG